MARPLRITFPGAFYHVTSRGNERRKIFLSQTDAAKFLSYLTDAVHKYGVVLHAYTLMGNHYHLLVETPKANLSAFAHGVNSAYTTYFNLKRKRSGHLFQGRYKSIVIEKDPYLLELSRYIHLNPVRAGIVQNPEAYALSSYRSYLSPREETIVSRELVWGMISGNRKEAPQRYREFVESALSETPPNPFEKVYGGAVLGKERFVKDVLNAVASVISKNETAQRRVLSSTVADVDEIIRFLSRHFGVPEDTVVCTAPYRSYAINLARKHTSMASADIARYFKVTCSAVTKMGTRLGQKLEQDGTLRDTMRRLEERLSHVNG